MERLCEPGFLFRVIAVLELAYAAVGLLPPEQITDLTGWVLTADGQWIAKLLAVALLSQAFVAWTLRDEPHLRVAAGLALYQIGSATADWVMWIVLAGDDVFSTTRGQVLVVASIVTHYALGLLLLRAIRLASPRQAGRRVEAAQT